MNRTRELLDLTGLVSLGEGLVWLQHALKAEDIYVKGEGNLYENLKDLRDDIRLNVRNPDLVAEVNAWLRSLRSYKANRKVRKSDCRSLSEDVGSWHDVIWDNLSRAYALRLCMEGSLNYPQLPEKGVQSFFQGKTYWDRLSKTSKTDLQNAAFCLMCGIPSASAMCSLRAAEDVFGQYYKSETGGEASKKTWNTCLRKLEARQDANKELLGQLDFIRKYRRNAAAHPGKLFSQKEAEKILLSVIESVEMMLAECE